jgi:hypothetical protein
MGHPPGRLYGLWLALIGSFALPLGFGMVGLSFWRTPMQDLAAARASWAGRPFERYHLVLEEFRGIGSCRQEIEVAGDRVAAVLQNTCPHPARTTVSDLFDRIEYYHTQRPCGPNGCDCDGAVGAQVVYDTLLGYPQQLHIASQRASRWQHTAYWKNRLQNGGRLKCVLAGYRGPRFSIVSLTPVP